MVEERVPDRFWLGVPLHYEQNPPKERQNESENFGGGFSPFSPISTYKNFQFKFLKKKMEKRDLQANDKALRRASNHSPTTWVNSIPIPILKHTMGILKRSFYTHQSLN